MTGAVVTLRSRRSPAAVSLGRSLTRGLTGGDADTVLFADDPAAVPLLEGADLLVVAATVAGHRVDPDVTALLRACDLSAATVFVAALGAWPAEANTAERELRPLLRRAGPSCLAPVLHVVDDAPAPVDRYCRYWGPVVPALLAAHLDRRVAS